MLLQLRTTRNVYVSCLPRALFHPTFKKATWARLVFRRIYRLLRMLGISEKLYDIVEMQINHWSRDFPHLKEMRNESWR